MPEIPPSKEDLPPEELQQELGSTAEATPFDTSRMEAALSETAAGESREKEEAERALRDFYGETDGPKQSERTAEGGVQEKKVDEDGREKRFKLPDLEEAEKKKYPWFEAAKASRDFLAGEIKAIEGRLNGENLPEDSAQLKRLREGLSESLAEYEKRWERLKVLSSEKEGSKDKELDAVSYARANELGRQPTQEESIRFNDDARKELLDKLREFIPVRESIPEVEYKVGPVAEVKEEVAITTKDASAEREEVPEKVAPEKREVTPEQRAEAWEAMGKEGFLREGPEKVEKIYYEATGENLAEEREQMLRQSIEARGGKFIEHKDAEAYAKQLVEREQKRAEERQLVTAKTACWARLSPEEKVKFGGMPGSPEFEEYLQEKRDVLGLTELGFAFLVNSGLVPEKAKEKKSLFRKHTFLDMPSTISGGKFRLTGKSAEDIAKWAEDQMVADINEQGEFIAHYKIIKGRQRLLRERALCAGALVEKALEGRPSPVKAEKEGAEILQSESAPLPEIDLSDFGAQKKKEEKSRKHGRTRRRLSGALKAARSRVSKVFTGRSKKAKLSHAT